MAVTKYGKYEKPVLTGIDLINHHIEEVEKELTPLKIEAIQVMGRGAKPITATILSKKATYLGMYHDFLVGLREEFGQFGKIRERGEYGGYVTDMYTLPVGTCFHVYNGGGRGVVVEVDNVKCLLVEGDDIHNAIPIRPGHMLEITIQEGSL